VLVEIAAEVVAGETEHADLVRRERQPREAARDDVGAQLEVGQAEAHDDVRAGELEHHGLALLQHDVAGHELEFLRGDADHLLLGERAQSEGARGGGEPGRKQQAPPRVRAHAFTTGNSLISYGVSVSTPRKPRPLYGCAGSQATGTRLGSEPGAGSAKISDFAEWCAMWAVMWWFSWWMWP